MKPAVQGEFKTSTIVVNELAMCKPIMEHYGMYDKIPVSIPMKLQHFTIPGKEMYVHMKMGLIDNNKTRLLQKVL